MCKKLSMIFLFCLLLLFCPALYSQDAEQQDLQQALQTTSSSIKSNLTLLKQQSDSMKMQLTEVSQALKSSQTTAAKWEQQSIALSNSLDSINSSLNNSYATITRYETQIKLLKNILIVLIVLLATRLATLFIGFVLYAKGVKLPRWLDILL